MKMVWNMKKYAFLAVLIWQLAAATNAQEIDLLDQRTGGTVVPECVKYSCSCISTTPMSHGGFGPPPYNSGIRIVRIDPRVTSITISYSANGAPFFSGLPFVGQFIRLNGKAYTKAYTNGVGLGCAVHFLTIDDKGNPRFPTGM